MRRPRFSIAVLMGVVALVAVNCAVIGAVMNGDSTSFALGLGLLPVADVLLVARYVSARGARRRGGMRHPFWVGFERAGLFAMIAYAAECWIASHRVIAYMEWVLLPVARLFEGVVRAQDWWHRVFFVGLEFTAPMAALAAPQIAVAAFGGWLVATSRPAPRMRRPDEPAIGLGPRYWPPRNDPDRRILAAPRPGHMPGT